MSATLTKSGSQRASAADAYVKLPLAAFSLDLVNQVDLYCRISDNQRFRLYRGAGSPVTSQDIENLRSRGHEALYVSSVDHAVVERQLFDNLSQVIANEHMAAHDRFALLQAAVALEVDVAFRLIKPNRYVALSSEMADHITTLIGTSDLLPRSMFDVVQHDYYTFTHVTNTAGFAVLLAEELGETDPATLKQIAKGALLHDLGKRFVPPRILCKPARLSSSERSTIEQHPTRGYLDLRDDPEMNTGQLMMIYQHHERLDGTGYPVAVTDEEIHPWAKMLAIVDVFDALTSKRPYRKPMSLEDALAYLRGRAGTHFDKEMIRCWSSALKRS